MSLVYAAVKIRYPIPAFAWMNSATTAASTEAADATRRAAKKNGKDDGIRSLINSWKREALSTLKRSTSRRSAALRPLRV